MGERVEVVLVAIRALGDLDQHPLREPALEVEHHHLVRVAGHADAAARGTQRRVGQQARHLFGEQRLDAGGTGKEQGQGHRWAIRGSIRDGTGKAAVNSAGRSRR